MSSFEILWIMDLQPCVWTLGSALVIFFTPPGAPNFSGPIGPMESHVNIATKDRKVNSY